MDQDRQPQREPRRQRFGRLRRALRAARSAFPTPRSALRVPRSALRAGYSLLEVMVVLTVFGVLIRFSVPRFQQAIEQARADMAVANLRAVWSAQRVYWLEYRTYAANLATLQSSGLIDPDIAASNTWYTYAISAATSSGFTAMATRVANAGWNGSFSVDATGLLSGSLSATGEPTIVPSYQ